MIDNNEPIRVLHIVGRMDRGGIETMIMNLYRNIDRSKVQFDFLAHYGREAAYNEEIRKLGGRIYEMPTLKDENCVYYWRFFQYVIALNKFFREHTEYKIIHGHMTNTAAIYMPIAQKYGVTCRIAHSHSTKGKAGLLGFVTDLLQRPVYKYATDWFACSKVAGYWFFPRKAVEDGKVVIVPNAVDAERFRFSYSTRKKMRKELGIEEKIVIGCVARFRPEKNLVFLIEVLKEAISIEPKAILVIAGEGPEEGKVRRKAAELGVEENVLFLGMRSDIPNVLQAFDVFTLTSFWEGLPVTGIEAQAAGLHCVVSDGVTKEIDALGMVKFLSLKDSKRVWAEELISNARKIRKDTYKMIIESGYDIQTTVPWLQDFYLKKNHK